MYNRIAMKDLKRSMQFSLSVFALIFFLSSSAFAEDAWKTFKATSDRNGAVSDGTVNLPLKVMWTYAPAGKSNGFVDWGPVAANGIVYTGDGLNNVIALDAKTGEVVWQKELISNIFSVSLSEDLKKLYVTTAITTKPTATLYALDAKTGEMLWDNMVNGQTAVGGMESSPAIADGKIFAAYLQYEGHGGVVAYNSSNGKLLWHLEVPRISPYSPVSYSDGRIYIGFENKTLHCFDAKVGRGIWSQTLTDLLYAAPAVADKKVFVGAGSNLYAFDARNGQLMWQKNVEAQIGHSSVSVDKKILYVGSRESKIFAFTVGEGSPVWTVDLQKGAVESSIIIDSKKKLLYFGTQSNRLLVLSAKDGRIKDEVQLSQDERGVWKSAPALYKGRVYVGSLDKNFYALE